MKRLRSSALLLLALLPASLGLVVLAGGCHGSEGSQVSPSERATSPIFTGMELYVWEDEAGVWQYALMTGTNRNKTIDEVYAQKALGLDDVKSAMSKMAVGEWVILVEYVDDGTGHTVKMPRPPEELIEELERWASECDVVFRGDYN